MLQNSKDLNWNIQLYLASLEVREWYDPPKPYTPYQWFMIVLGHDSKNKFLEMFYYR